MSFKQFLIDERKKKRKEKIKRVFFKIVNSISLLVMIWFYTIILLTRGV